VFSAMHIKKKRGLTSQALDARCLQSKTPWSANDFWSCKAAILKAIVARVDSPAETRLIVGVGRGSLTSSGAGSWRGGRATDGHEGAFGRHDQMEERMRTTKGRALGEEK
jgi:hypothetical protein